MNVEQMAQWHRTLVERFSRLESSYSGLLSLLEPLAWAGPVQADRVQTTIVETVALAREIRDDLQVLAAGVGRDEPLWKDPGELRALVDELFEAFSQQNRLVVVQNLLRGLAEHLRAATISHPVARARVFWSQIRDEAVGELQSLSERCEISSFPGPDTPSLWFHYLCELQSTELAATLGEIRPVAPNFADLLCELNHLVFSEPFESSPREDSPLGESKASDIACSTPPCPSPPIEAKEAETAIHSAPPLIEQSNDEQAANQIGDVRADSAEPMSEGASGLSQPDDLALMGSPGSRPAVNAGDLASLAPINVPEDTIDSPSRDIPPTAALQPDASAIVKGAGTPDEQIAPGSEVLLSQDQPLVNELAADSPKMAGPIAVANGTSATPVIRLPDHLISERAETTAGDVVMDSGASAGGEEPNTFRTKEPIPSSGEISSEKTPEIAPPAIDYDREETERIIAFCQAGDYLRAAILSAACGLGRGQPERDLHGSPNFDSIVLAHGAEGETPLAIPEWCRDPAAVLDRPQSSRLAFVAILRNSLTNSFLCQRIELAREAYFAQFRLLAAVDSWLHHAWEIVLNPGLLAQVTKQPADQWGVWRQLWRKFRGEYDDSLRAPTKGAYSRRQKHHMNSSQELRFLYEAVRDDREAEAIPRNQEQRIRTYLLRSIRSLIDEWIESTRRVSVVKLTDRQRREVEESTTAYVALAQAALDAKASATKLTSDTSAVRQAEHLRISLRSSLDAALEEARGEPWDPIFRNVAERICP